MHQVVTHEMFVDAHNLTVCVDMFTGVIGMAVPLWPHSLWRVEVEVARKRKLFQRFTRKIWQDCKSTWMQSAHWDSTKNSSVEWKCHLLSRYFIKDENKALARQHFDTIMHQIFLSFSTLWHGINIWEKHKTTSNSPCGHSEHVCKISSSSCWAIWLKTTDVNLPLALEGKVTRSTTFIAWGAFMPG